MYNPKISTAKAVRELIESNPYVRNTIAEGLINFSALARNISPELEAKLGRKINGDSLIVAIKRYADEIKGRTIKNDYLRIFANSTLAMQEDMSYVILERNEKTVSIIESLLKETNWQIGELRIIVQGAEKIIALLKSQRLKKLLERTDNELIEYVSEKTLVTIRPPPESRSTYGVIAELASVLSKKGITIELITAHPDLHFLVDEKEAEEAYHTIKDLIKKAKDTLEANHKL